jgi:hypothetical protein
MAFTVDQFLVAMGAAQARSVTAPAARALLGLGALAVLDAPVDDSVTNAKLANVASLTIKGRIAGGNGDPQDLTASEVITILTGADGSGSGLDADLLDGQHAAAFAAASHTHDAADIIAGLLALARGGTHTDLSATGGTGKVLKQKTVGGDIAVETIAASELPPHASTHQSGGSDPIGPPPFLAAEDGPEGPPGPPGLPGAAGVAGATGNTGAQGPSGPPIFLLAEQGEDGFTGPPGLPGATGATGSTGNTGAQGPIGPPIFLTAEDGPEGPMGPPGPPNTLQPSFKVHISGDVAIALAATKITFDVVDFDTFSYWDSTNKGYKPQMPGKYLIFAAVGSKFATTANVYQQVFLYKNAVAEIDTFQYVVTSGHDFRFLVAAIIDLNGSSDIVYCYAGTNDGSSPAVQAPTYMWGVRVSS